MEVSVFYNLILKVLSLLPHVICHIDQQWHNVGENHTKVGLSGGEDHCRSSWILAITVYIFIFTYVYICYVIFKHFPFLFYVCNMSFQI